MKYIPRVDVSPLRHFVIAGVVCAAGLLLAIIIGAAGPRLLLSESYFAYECPDSSHCWTDNCTGVQLAKGEWSKNYTIDIHDLNQHWYLNLFPYKNTNTPALVFDVDVDLRITIEGKDNGDTAWTSVTENYAETVEMSCRFRTQECIGFTLVSEDAPSFDKYQVRVRLDNAKNTSLGDFKFEFGKGNPKFFSMWIAFKTLFLVASIAAAIVYYVKLRSIERNQKQWEQQMTLVLALALICYNNPLYGFEFLARNWILVFIGSLLDLVFTCTLFLFWLFMADKIRLEEKTVTFKLVHVPKVVFVSLYALAALVLYCWSSIHNRMLPVYAIEDHLTGIQVMFYIVSVLYIFYMFALSILIVVTVPKVLESRYLASRFMFFAIPTGVCLLSIVVGIFRGTVGPFGRDTIGTVYFTSMYNVYVYLLIWGYWPVPRGYSEANATETDSFQVQNKSYTAETSNEEPAPL